MRVRFAAVPLSVAAIAALAAGGLAQDDAPAPAKSDVAPRWMVRFDAAKDKEIGLEEGELKKWIEKTHGGAWPKETKDTSGDWDKLWKEQLLLQTPAIKVSLPEYAISKYEVTNAQWARFLEDRMDTYETRGDENLEQLVIGLWELNPDKAQAQIQMAWKTLLERNKAALRATLQIPDDESKWDPVLARAQQKTLPKGIKLRYFRYLPPSYWDKGTVPEWELKKPIREISFEQAEDFCLWAGLHLPTEVEWERAARGPKDWLFPWGEKWDPLAPIWKGYNRAVADAKKAKDPNAHEFVLAHGEQDPQLESVPCPVEVDSHPESGGPLGIFHMLGNVGEYTASRMWNYPGTKAATRRNDGIVLVGRGNSYADRAELMIATDRNSEGQLDRLLPSHRTESWGFRPAWYPVPGADLTLPLALRYNDGRTHPVLPHNWLPLPAGFTSRSDKAWTPYVGFEVTRTAGFLDRHIRDEDPNLVYVTAAAQGLAFLPAKGLAAEKIKSVADLQEAAADPSQCVVLGVLTGSMGSGFQFLTSPEQPDAMAFADSRLSNTHRDAWQIGRRYTAEHLGALVVYEDKALVLYRPDNSLYSASKREHRTQVRIGTLCADEPVVEEAKSAPPTATRKGNDVTLSAFLPYLDKKGEPQSNGKGIRLTFTVKYMERLDPKPAQSD